jgi:hypothetical protein
MGCGEGWETPPLQACTTASGRWTQSSGGGAMTLRARKRLASAAGRQAQGWGKPAPAGEVRVAG